MPQIQAAPLILALASCLLCATARPLEASSQQRPPLSAAEVGFTNVGSQCPSLRPLPEPTGHHQVGVASYHWIDRSRPEALTEDPNDDRQIAIELFYPALRVPDGPPAAYIPELDFLRRGFATDRRELPRRIANDLEGHGCVLSHAFRERPVDDLDPAYPVVLISPGGNVSRHWHTALATELASHGWAVAVISHAHSGLDVFPSGGFLMSSARWNAPDTTSAAERARLDEELAALLAADASFTLDRLSALALSDPHDRFTDRLDTDRVAIIGHSRGGSTVTRACSEDARFAACVVYDNIGSDREVRSGLDRPQLTVRRPWPEERIERLHAFLSRNRTVAVDAEIGGAVHMSFTDLPFVEPDRHPSPLAASQIHRITADLTLAFLDHHVLDRDRHGLSEATSSDHLKVRHFGADPPEQSAPAMRSPDPKASDLAVGDPGEHGISPAAIQSAHALADSLGTATYMLVVDGRVLDTYGDAARRYRLHSVRKSLLGALYGTAVAAARVDTAATIGALGLDDYGGLSHAERSATLAQLLSSRSGVYRPATHENVGFDDVRPAAGSHAPGAYWFYSNWDFNAAGTALQLLTGENLFGTFEREIARPIGMLDFRTADGAWRYEARSWHPAYVFRMSTRDLARFGVLMANEGRWMGNEVIPAEWVERMTRPRSRATRPDGEPMAGVGYGMMWWTRDAAAAKEAYGNIGESVFEASGTGSQLLVVAAGRNLVFVHRADTDRTDTDRAAEDYRSISPADAGRILKLLLGSG